MVTQLSARDLADWLADGARPAPQLLDVREAWEVEHCAIAGSLAIPLGSVPARATELDPARPLVCICHHGGRSMQAAHYLAQRGFDNIYNLAGGVDAWALQIEPSMPRY